MTLSAWPPDPEFRTGYTIFVDAEFLLAAAARGLKAFKGATWNTRARALDTDLEVLASAQYDYNGTNETLVQVGASIAHLIQRERSLTVRLAAPDVMAAANAEDQLRRAFPQPPTQDLDTELSFWWARPEREPGNVTRAHQIDAWEAISDNYSASVREQMTELISLERPETGGRLILFHGQPGTGKTNATLCLAREWSGWAEFGFVTDPERLFADPGYLLGIVSRRALRASNRWQVLVLEDAGEFLTPYAKAENGQALSRLLNITDGALGTATNTLLLCTTNEELRELHPAASRPGRCLADLSFPPLTRSETTSWCHAHQVDTEPLGAMTLAELYALRAGRPARPQRAGFGFAAA